jgi:hypothetical protein
VQIQLIVSDFPGEEVEVLCRFSVSKIENQFTYYKLSLTFLLGSVLVVLGHRIKSLSL